MANRRQKLRVAAIRRALHAQLPQPVDESQIADGIEKYLFKYFETVPGKRKLAGDLASHISGQFLVTGKRVLDWLRCIIETYPEQLEGLSNQASLESLMRLLREGKLTTTPVARVPRKFWSPTTRIKRKQRSKNLYEFKRKRYRLLCSDLACSSESRCELLATPAFCLSPLTEFSSRSFNNALENVRRRDLSAQTGSREIVGVCSHHAFE